MLLDIFLFNFSNLFVLLIGLNFACVYLIRPKGSGSNHFFFDIIDAISGYGIANIITKTNETFREIEKLSAKIDLYLKFAEKTKYKTIDKKTATTLSAHHTILKNEYASNVKKDTIDKLGAAYQDKIKKKTESLHLPIICGLLGLYGILVLIFAAIDTTEKQSAMTSFLFWSNILILIFLFVCILAEGDIWFNGKEKPKRYKICCFFNKIFHPHLKTVLIVFLAIFAYFILSLNNIVIFGTPTWITDRNIIYFTLIVSVVGFLGYLIWNNVYVICKTIQYKEEAVFENLKKGIEGVDKFIQEHKAEFDKLDKGLDDMGQATTDDFSLFLK